MATQAGKAVEALVQRTPVGSNNPFEDDHAYHITVANIAHHDAPWTCRLWWLVGNMREPGW